jgi:hypothetical protein
MATKAESLAAYWAANPGSMEVGMANTPTAWGIAEEDYGTSGLTGFQNDNQAVTTWNPETQQYDYNVIGEDESWRDWNPSSDNTGWYNNSQGDFVLGNTPEGFSQYRPDSLEGGWQEGIDPQPMIDPSLVGYGMGDNGYQTGITDEMAAANQIPIPGAGPQPGIPQDNGYDGDPFNPDYYNGQPVGANQFGSGGNNSVDPGYGVGAGPDVPLQGYESSTNKDFYQQQFANMRAQGMRNQAREGMAYDARQEVANQDPFQFNSDTAFDWYNDGQGLPEVTMGTGQGTEGAWSVNDWVTPGETSNADILRAALDKSTFGEGNVNLAEGLLAGPGDMDNDYSWAQFENPNAVIDAMGGGYGTENENMVRAALNNTFTQAPGGPAAPVGYANPV